VLDRSIRSAAPLGPVHVFVSRSPWHGDPGDWRAAVRCAQGAGANIRIGDWPDKGHHWNAALQEMKRAGYEFLVLLGADEVVSEKLASSISILLASGVTDRLYVEAVQLWKSSDYRIWSGEPKWLPFAVRASLVQAVSDRECGGGSEVRLRGDGNCLWDLGFCGSTERLVRKLERNPFPSPIPDTWWEQIWSSWNTRPFLRNLHPTEAARWVYAHLTDPPENLEHLSVAPSGARSIALPVSTSIVIPLYGGPHEIRQCLASIEPIAAQLAEVVVVDDCSPDNAANVVGEFPWAALVRNERNVGFAATCNRGFEHTSAEVIVFLNSDTILCPSALEALIASLRKDPKVGAAGPHSNYVAFGQSIDIPYTDLQFYERFAQQFASSTAPDRTVDALSGFCLAVKRDAFFKVGMFDAQFAVGQWEDNDLSYRLLRAGYRLVISTASFIHHHGSCSLGRAGSRANSAFSENGEYYARKWSDDIATGRVTGVPGLSQKTIIFAPESASIAEAPLVSAVCCTYGRPRLLEEAIASFLLQDYPNKELVIVNDLPSHAISLPGTHANITIINCPLRFPSLGAKRNFAMTQANGEYVLVWDDDDLHLPWRMSEAIAYLNPNPQFDGVRPATSLFSTDNADYQRFSNGLYGQACYRRSYVEERRYDEKVSCGEDWRYESAGRILAHFEPRIPWIVCRWGLGIYHISGRGECDHELNWRLAGDYVESKGLQEESLSPRWQRNYFDDLKEPALRLFSADERALWDQATESVVATSQFDSLVPRKSVPADA